MSQIDILIPTWNLPQYAVPCVASILRTLTEEIDAHIYVINNGDSTQSDFFPKSPFLTVLNQDRNLGWESGLKAGLSKSSAPYVVFMNDDTYVPLSSYDWLSRMLVHFSNPHCGAVGPGSNVVMGGQNIFLDTPVIFKVPFLIGLCMMLRRDVLDAVGGVDDTLSGADDLDLSYRLRRAGNYLVCDKSVFIYHHGFKSGERLLGGSHVKGGWNSVEKIENDNFGLIRKHGIRGFMDMYHPPENIAVATGSNGLH